MKEVLKPYCAMAEMLGQTLGADCEVVLHDRDTPEHSVVYVVNGAVTGRRVGDSFDHLIRQVILSEERQGDFVANYYFTAQNGKLIRSSTLLIKSPAGRLEGALCINLDMSRITGQLEFLQSFLPDAPRGGGEKAPDENQTVTQMITGLIDNILSGCEAQALSREQKLEKIRFMDEKGVFLMKGSIEQVAGRLGISTVTVYSYLDVIRGKRRKGKQ